ncbi:protein of unknown function [Caloramator quimbayensis]|uniref:DUF4867 domain-containing protein n=1 Tax=Caloramator quimbayensis TaxID=1147123 RepID=A0A1T4XWT5_9CLOT|nr:DUF4867 family protein [Caloramator quimbayensis]SKA93668.1 protein of unknown function [Caloramator quimbayensis]
MEKEGIKIHDIKSLEFKKYGRIIEGYDFKEAIEYLEYKTQIPAEGNIYVASDENLEKLRIKKQIQKFFYGDIDVQFGYCNGKNSKLNALEYHKSSEIDVAATDMILLLGDIRDIVNNSYETKNVEAFFINKGTAIELYSTTLHFSPIKTFKDGFKCIVILPKGTNMSLTEEINLCDEESKILFARNKWLLCHEDNKRLIDRGAYIGLKGENIEIIL